MKCTLGSGKEHIHSFRDSFGILHSVAKASYQQLWLEIGKASCWKAEWKALYWIREVLFWAEKRREASRGASEYAFIVITHGRGGVQWSGFVIKLSVFVRLSGFACWQQPPSSSFSSILMQRYILICGLKDVSIHKPNSWTILQIIWADETSFTSMKPTQERLWNNAFKCYRQKTVSLIPSSTCREMHYFKPYYFNNVTWDYSVHQSNVLEAWVHLNLKAKCSEFIALSYVKKIHFLPWENC